MTRPVAKIRRKNTFNLFREAPKLESFDEYPLLRPEVDPQLHVSRNAVDQPFWLSCAKDSLLTQSSGASRVLFRDGPVRYFDVAPGEYVYVPADAVHRVMVSEPGVLVRYKARETGGEAAVWFCDNCDGELHRTDLPIDRPIQSGYAAAAEGFNGDANLRTCTACGMSHPPLDLTPFRWREVAAALEQGEDDD